MSFGFRPTTITRTWPELRQKLEVTTDSDRARTIIEIPAREVAIVGVALEEAGPIRRHRREIVQRVAVGEYKTHLMRELSPVMH